MELFSIRIQRTFQLVSTSLGLTSCALQVASNEQMSAVFSAAS